ncbi:mitochondrial carrier domain-containing protein [Entophlyctis helioformis]|nr:mitochondrial carrier domain-containing protein [Entophlyctis helioformis]
MSTPHSTPLHNAGYPYPAILPAAAESSSLAAHSTKKSSGLGTKLVCGAIAGVIGTTLIFPLDIVKTRLQTQRIGPNGPQYRGIVDCARQIVAQGGLRGLYQGLIPNLIGICPEKAIKLAVNDYSREFWGRRLGVHPDHLPVFYGLISGATAGFCQVVATNPMEIVKIQMQLATAAPAAPGAPAAPKLSAMSIVRSLGLRGLYRGTTATLCRDVPFSFVFFPMVSILKAALTPAPAPGMHPSTVEVPFASVFGSGIVSGAIAAAAVTPMDVVKTRLQAGSRGGAKVYKGMLHCYQDIIKTEGVHALFKGVVPRVMIVSPLFAITVLIYEFQQRYISKLVTPTESDLA